MSVIAHFSVPAEDFPLGRALEVDTGTRIRLESMVPTRSAVIPYFWVRGADPEAIRRTLADDPLAERVEIVDRIDGEALFRVDWTSEINGLIGAIIDRDAVIMEGVGSGDSWNFQLRFSNYNDLSAFYRECVTREVPLELKQVHNPVESGRRTRFGLTDEQRETLVTALEAGYFSVPRETTLVELGEAMHLSDSAVSQRMRRGLSALISATLLSDISGNDF